MNIICVRNRGKLHSINLLASLLLLSGTPALAASQARGLADNALSPASVSAMQAGDAALARRETQLAIDSFEAALAADPRNVAAFVGLARAAEADGLPGKAVRFYREALAINPNDLSIIEAQGNAFLARGARGRAEANLDRLKKLCTGGCPEAERLTASIARTATAATTAVATTTASAERP